MFKDERNYHQRLQEFCDCFMETDFKGELEKASQGFSGDPHNDPDEMALKFLGLMFLYGANEEAKEIRLQRKKDGQVSFSVQARGSYQLAAPPAPVADKIMAIARDITHLEEDQGEEPFSLGLRNDRLEVRLRFERANGGETLSLNFPA